LPGLIKHADAVGIYLHHNVAGDDTLFVKVRDALEGIHARIGSIRTASDDVDV